MSQIQIWHAMSLHNCLIFYEIIFYWPIKIMKSIKRITPSVTTVLSDEELRFLHRILVLYEKYGTRLVTVRFDDKSISHFLNSHNLSTPHDTKKNKIWIEETKDNFIQFKGSGNIPRRLVRYIRHSFAHNRLEKVNGGTEDERIHFQNWKINRKINDNKPYCDFDASIKFCDLKDLMQLMLPKYFK